MDKDLIKLLEQISSLPDDELVRMLNLDYADYRPEAIAFAKVVMANRGFQITKKGKVSSKKSETLKQKEQP